MTPYKFNDSNIQWQPFGDFEHFVYSILNINEKNLIFDVLFKFEANKTDFSTSAQSIKHNIRGSG
jgi:hypothetical protein